MKRARGYLRKIEGAVSGSGGHDKTFRAACTLVQGFGLSKEQALPLLLEWNERCQPPWSEAEIHHKLDDAAKQSGPVGTLLKVRSLGEGPAEARAPGGEGKRVPIRDEGGDP